MRKHEIPVLGSFRDQPDEAEILRSMTKHERQRMGPTDRATIMANTAQRGRRRNVCGSVTDSLYQSLGSGIHSMMDSIVSKIIYKPKPKYHK